MKARRGAIILAGAARAGTTFLHTILAGHPSVRQAWIKEPQFLATTALGHLPFAGPGDGSLARIIPRSRDEYVGLWGNRDLDSRPLDSSTWTSYVPGAIGVAEEIWDEPEYLLILRDPLDRAHSAWKHLRARGRESQSFESALDREDQRVRDGWSPIWHLTRMSDSTIHVRNLQSAVPASRIHVIKFDDLVADPRGLALVLYRELALGPGPVEVVDARNSSPGRGGAAMGGVLWPTHPGVLRAVSRLPAGVRVGARRMREAMTRHRAEAPLPSLSPRHRDRFEALHADYEKLMNALELLVPPSDESVEREND